MIDALCVIDVDGEALLAAQFEREHVDAGQRTLDQARDLALERPLRLLLLTRHLTIPLDKKWAQRAHPKTARNGDRTVAESALSQAAPSGVERHAAARRNAAARGRTTVRDALDDGSHSRWLIGDCRRCGEG